MLSILAGKWWVFLVRGLFAILFGFLAILMPGITLATLVIFFGAYVFVDGIFSIIGGITSYKKQDRWWALLLEGIASVLVGVLTFANPRITAIALVYLIAAWALVTGFLEITTAIQLRHEIEGEWMMILSGLFSIVFGVLIFANPGTGALSLIWVIGAYAIAFGTTLIVLGFKLRSLPNKLDKFLSGE